MRTRHLCLAGVVMLGAAASAAAGGLVAHCDFARDGSDSAGESHAKLVGGAAVVDDPGGAGKGPSTVLHLPNDDAFARCEGPQLSFKGSLTVMLWLKAHHWWRTPGPHSPRPSDIGDDYDGIVVGPGFALSRAYADLRFEAGGLNVSAPHRKLSRWHHIAAVYQPQPPDAKGRPEANELEGNAEPAADKAGLVRTWAEKRTLQLYVDGELVASTSKEVALDDLPKKQAPKPVPLTIGGMEGFLDDVRIYDTALSKEAIAGIAERRFASEEHPLHGSDAVDPGTALVWKAGVKAASHDVYFGSDPAQLEDATRQSRCFKGNQAATTYKPQGLEPGGKAYCWRVDEVEADGTVRKGGVMQFTTGTLAFPGAEGCGAFARGGRGGKVLCVANLDDYDPKTDKPIPGSLRAACAEKGPRTIIFRVSGTIALKADLIITEPYLTIAGQTAPGDGICVKMRHSQISTHDVVVRHMRFRLGDELGGEGFAQIKGTFEADALRLLWAQRVTVDHCSLSWALDETMDIWDSSDVTVQWSILAESLARSFHSKGRHSMGIIISGGDVSVQHNLFAKHNTRSPRPAGDTLLDFRNNVIYLSNGYVQKGGMRLNYVGNYIKRPNRKQVFSLDDHPGAFMFMAGNCLEGDPEGSRDNWRLVAGPAAGAFKMKDPFALWSGTPVTTDRAEDACRKVLATAGAALPKRDAVDARILREYESGTGEIIDSQKDVGGYPELKSAPPPADSDNDGMPDAWETQHGLDPKDPSDANADPDGDLYTNIEEWLNGTNPRQKDAIR